MLLSGHLTRTHIGADFLWRLAMRGSRRVILLRGRVCMSFDMRADTTSTPSFPRGRQIRVINTDQIESDSTHQFTKSMVLQKYPSVTCYKHPFTRHLRCTSCISCSTRLIPLNYDIALDIPSLLAECIHSTPSHPLSHPFRTPKTANQLPPIKSTLNHSNANCRRNSGRCRIQ